MLVQLAIKALPESGYMAIDTRKQAVEYNFRVPGVSVILATMDYSRTLHYSAAYTVDEIVNSIKAANNLSDDEVVLKE